MIELVGAAVRLQVHAVTVELKAVLRRIDANGNNRLMRGGFQCTFVALWDAHGPSDARLHAVGIRLALARAFAPATRVRILPFGVGLPFHVL